MTLYIIKREKKRDKLDDGVLDILSFKRKKKKESLTKYGCNAFAYMSAGLGFTWG